MLSRVAGQYDGLYILSKRNPQHNGQFVLVPVNTADYVTSLYSVTKDTFLSDKLRATPYNISIAVFIRLFNNSISTVVIAKLLPIEW